MTERMTDERLAYLLEHNDFIHSSLCPTELYNELLQALKAERAEVARLQTRWNDVYLVRTQADKLSREAWGHKEGAL